MKRRSVGVLFLCKLEKMEKYFTVNWGIIREHMHNTKLNKKAKIQILYVISEKLYS